MDTRRFFRFTRPLFIVGTRREAMVLLAALTILGTLTTLLGEEAIEPAAGSPAQRTQRRRRKHRNAVRRRRNARRKRESGDDGLLLECIY